MKKKGNNTNTAPFSSFVVVLSKPCSRVHGECFTDGWAGYSSTVARYEGAFNSRPILTYAAFLLLVSKEGLTTPISDKITWKYYVGSVPKEFK